MKNTENKYIGDEAFEKLLEHYKCPLALDVVKMRFAGAVCSPNLELRPGEVISSFWPAGQEPRLENKEEAELFFKFFMGLWDEVFEKVKANKIRLPSFDDEDFGSRCHRRFMEVYNGYVEGFWGGKKDIKMPAYLAETVDSLEDLAAVYEKLSSKKASPETESALNNTDNMVEKTIAFIIENSVLPRIESLRRNVN